MADRLRLKQLEKLESCVMTFWDRLDEDMQEEIRQILDHEEVEVQ
jgi:hypothetical protein